MKKLMSSLIVILLAVSSMMAQTPSSESDVSICLAAVEHAHTLSDVPFGENPWAYAIRKNWHVRFEDVPLGQPYDSFIEILTGRLGYKVTEKDGKSTTLQGTWNGFAGTKVIVYQCEGTAYRVEVYTAKQAQKDAQNRFNAILDGFCEYTGLDGDSVMASSLERVGSDEVTGGSWCASYGLAEGSIVVEMSNVGELIDLSVEEYQGLKQRIASKRASHKGGKGYNIHVTYRDNHPSDRIRIGKEYHTLGELAAK